MSQKLYVIHGWTYTIEPWRTVRELLANDNIELVMLQVPGLTGKSDKVWTIEGYVEWLQEQLKDVSRPIVLGHSNGGRIALNYLIKYPGSFKHLILLNSAGVYEAPRAVSFKRKLFKVLSKMLKPLKYIPLVRRVVYRVLGASDYDRAPANMKKTLQNMLSSDMSLELNHIEDPISIIWGKEDRTTPLGQGKKMHQLLKNSSFLAVNEWGHAPYITHPQQLALEIQKIVEKV